MPTADERVERLEHLLRDCPAGLDSTTAGLLADWLVERGVVALAPGEQPSTEGCEADRERLDPFYRLEQTPDECVERVAQLLDEWWARNQGCDLKTWLADHHVVALAPGKVVVPRDSLRHVVESAERGMLRGPDCKSLAALRAAIAAGERSDA